MYGFFRDVKRYIYNKEFQFSLLLGTLIASQG